MIDRKRVVAFISGRGSNLGALHAATLRPDYPAEIVGVLSNVAGAGGLEFAHSVGLATEIVSHKDRSREHFEGAISEVLSSWNVDIVCLAGFMRLLTPSFTKQWAGRMLNVHPALLPTYPGLRTHERAIADRAKLHGCTVHLVTPEMDEGPQIIQSTVSVDRNDTAESLGERVLKEEHAIYPLALEWLATSSNTEAGRTLWNLSQLAKMDSMGATARVPRAMVEARLVEMHVRPRQKSWTGRGQWWESKERNRFFLKWAKTSQEYFDASALVSAFKQAELLQA